jgi:hypothetical protein
MCVYVHTYVRVYALWHADLYILCAIRKRYIHTYILVISMRAHTHTQTQPAYTFIHIYMLYIHLYTDTRTHTHRNTPKMLKLTFYAHIHTCMHAYIHTYLTHTLHTHALTHPRAYTHIRTWEGEARLDFLPINGTHLDKSDSDSDSDSDSASASVSEPEPGSDHLPGDYVVWNGTGPDVDKCFFCRGFEEMQVCAIYVSVILRRCRFVRYMYL